MACLDDSTLAQFIEGTLAPEAAAQVESHVDSCEACRELLSSVAKVALGATVLRANAEADGASAAELGAGAVVDGRYRLDRYLGAGGMGIVFVGTHLALGQPIALKFMKASALGDAEAVSRFMREARIVAQLKSEHIGRVLDLGTLTGGAPYLVMEYLEGEDLERVLARQGPLPVPDAVQHLLQALEGIAEAHAANVIHRDLKPANLFLTRQGGKSCIKVLDFGVSKWRDPKPGVPFTATKSNVLMGSPSYMAPEQLVSSASVDARADIWSLGCTLYQLLTGRLPFEARGLPELTARILRDPPTPLRTWRAEAPAALEELLSKCFEKDPSRRYPDLAALRAALVRVQALRGRRAARARSLGPLLAASAAGAGALVALASWGLHRPAPAASLPALPPIEASREATVLARPMEHATELVVPKPPALLNKTPRRQAHAKLIPAVDPDPYGSRE